MRKKIRWLSGYRLSFLPARSGVRRGPAILSGAPKAERKATPNHITNVSYPGLYSIEQHICSDAARQFAEFELLGARRDRILRWVCSCLSGFRFPEPFHGPGYN